MWGQHAVQAGLRPFPALLIDQDGLLPSAWHLVRAMNAASPATGPLLALQQLFTGPFNAALASLRLLRIIDPADEFIAAERCQVLPQQQYARVGLQGLAQVVTCLMHRAMRKIICHKNLQIMGSHSGRNGA